MFPIRSRKTKECLLSVLLFNTVLVLLASAIIQETVFIHRWHDHLCTKSDGIYKKASRTKKYFSKVAAYKINTKKLIIFPHTSNKKLKSEIKSHNMYNSIKIKYLGINLIKGVKDLQWKLKKLLGDIRKGLNKWRNTLCSWIKRQNIVKKSMV